MNLLYGVLKALRPILTHRGTISWEVAGSVHPACNSELHVQWHVLLVLLQVSSSRSGKEVPVVGSRSKSGGKSKVVIVVVDYKCWVGSGGSRIFRGCDWRPEGKHAARGACT